MKSNSNRNLLVIGVVALTILLVWKRQPVTTAYRLNDQLSLQGSEGTFTIVGIWPVNGVTCYIMENPGVIGQVAYPVTEIDNDSAWSKTG